MQHSQTAVSRQRIDELKALERERHDLVNRIAAEDQDALAALYDATSRSVFALALRVLGEPGVAEDVTLEVFTQVWRQASRYDPRRGTPTAWLLTIARSRAIDKLRSTHQTRTRTEPISSVEATMTGGESPAEAAAEEERRRYVRAALDSLPREQREVIELAYFGGLSHSEIAERLEQPLGTVKTRTRLGLMRLREALRPLEGEL